MSTLIITEKQYDKLILNSVALMPKKIRVTENQYSRLLLKEGCGPGGCKKPVNFDSGWSTFNGKPVDVSTEEGYNSFWENPYFLVGNHPIHISYFCGPMMKGGLINRTDSFGSYQTDYTGKSDASHYPSKAVEKWVKDIWRYGGGGTTQTMRYVDGPGIIEKGINKYIEAIESGKIVQKQAQYDGLGNKIKPKILSPDDKFIKYKIKALQGLLKSAENYPQHGTCTTVVEEEFVHLLWGTVKEFFTWLGTLDAQDWLDIAAAACVVVSAVFPPAAVIAMPLAIGLEAINTGISVYKLATGTGSWGDLWLRLGCLIAGPFLGRLIKPIFKFGKNAVVKGFGYAIEFGKWVVKKGSKYALKWLNGLKLNKKTYGAVKEWLEVIGKNPEEFKKASKSAEEIVEGVAKGDKTIIKLAKNRMEKVGRYFSGKGQGGIFKSQYVDDIMELPGKLGGIIIGGLVGGIYALNFYTWLKQQEFTDEQIQKISDGIDQTLKEKNPRYVTIAQAYKEGFSPEVLDDLTEEEQEELLKDYNNILEDWYKNYEKIKASIKKIRDKRNNLYDQIANFCEDFKLPGGETISAVEIGHTRTEEEIKLRQERAKKGKKVSMGGGEYSIIVQGAGAGIYRLNKEGNWVNTITDEKNCKLGSKVVDAFCKVNAKGNKFNKEFCTKVYFEENFNNEDAIKEFVSNTFEMFGPKMPEITK